MFQNNFGIPYPQKEWFNDPHQGIPETGSYVKEVFSETQSLKIIDHYEYPESGGTFVYHIGFKYPSKGFPTPDSVATNNVLKHFLINQVKFFEKLKIGFLFNRNKLGLISEWINDFCFTCELILFRIQAADPEYGQYFPQDKYYSDLCRELRVLVSTFLKELGVKDFNTKYGPDYFAKIFATLIEYDSAYWFRIKDILTETTKEKLLKNPSKEIKLMLRAYARRDKTRPHMIKKFNRIGTILSLALLYPKARKAFNKAIVSVNFENMKLDEADRYNILIQRDYDSQDIDQETRLKMYREPHIGKDTPMLSR